MKVNQHQALHTRKVLLVPYSEHHVPTYHAWMQDAELQAATASEPLTIEEEYAMQRSWREDRDKLTFIVCQPLETQRERVRVGIDDAPDRMIGDVNLFLSQPDDDNDDNDDKVNDDHGSTRPSETSRDAGVVGELELMIARKSHHRQGYGRAALLTLMGYILFHWPSIYLEYTGGQHCTPWPPAQQSSSHSNPKSAKDLPAIIPPAQKRPELRYLGARIQECNTGSLALFEGVGFKRTAQGANYFGEVELRWQDDGGFLRRLKDLEWMRSGTWEAGMVPYEADADCARA
ncbi:hypothetical protein LTR53_008415 [Teratosphaeriaceae sp. CCFEE 6253]|nr:hypothetical protein LTR53_008415 [Teratosphaeriaceae sp. CCFEE 6253]